MCVITFYFFIFLSNLYDMLSLNGKIHQARAVFPVLLLSWVIGLGTGWLGPMIPYLRESSNFGLSATEASWIVSLHYIGKLFGSYLSAVTLDIIGRQYLFLVGAVLSVFTWLFVYYGNVVMWLYLSRIIYGVTAGINETVSPIYITENCSPGIRGVFCSLSNASFFGGVLTVYVLAKVCPSYHTVTLVNIAFSLIAIVSMAMLRETPQYLLMKGKDKKAKKQFQWLQASDSAQTQQRFNEFQNNITERKTDLSIAEILNDPENRTGLRFVLIINVLTMLTGYTGVNNFITTTFKEFKDPSPETMTILYGMNSLIFCSMNSLGFDLVGRRKALLTASFVSFSVHFLFALLQYMHSQNVKIFYYIWILLACNSLYGILFSTVFCPVFTIIRGELLPQNVKALGSSLGVMCNALTSFLVANVFLLVAETFGYYLNFAFYSFFSIVLFIYVYYYLPESRRKSLVAIQLELNINLSK